MPDYLFLPEIHRKVHTLQQNGQILVDTPLYRFIIHCLHSPLEWDPNGFGRKFQFKIVDVELVNEFLETIKEVIWQNKCFFISSRLQRFKNATEPHKYKVLFVFMGPGSPEQIELFQMENQLTKEILALRRLFFPKMFELQRRGAIEVMEQQQGDGENGGGGGQGRRGCRVLVNLFKPMA